MKEQKWFDTSKLPTNPENLKEICQLCEKGEPVKAVISLQTYASRVLSEDSKRQLRLDFEHGRAEIDNVRKES